MNLYQKIVPIAIVLGVLGGCASSLPVQEETPKYWGEKDYLEEELPLFEDACDKSYNEGPFFDDMPCDEEILPKKRYY